jgi:hypothetical protein
MAPVAPARLTRGTERGSSSGQVLRARDSQRERPGTSDKHPVTCGAEVVRTWPGRDVVRTVRLMSIRFSAEGSPAARMPRSNVKNSG